MVVCENILWKNDKLFKVPNAINQDCFRCHCYVCAAREMWWCWSCLNLELYKHTLHIRSIHAIPKHSDSKSIALVTETPHHFTINLLAGWLQQQRYADAKVASCQWPIHQTKQNQTKAVCNIRCVIVQLWRLWFAIYVFSVVVLALLWVCASPIHSRYIQESPLIVCLCVVAWY